MRTPLKTLSYQVLSLALPFLNTSDVISADVDLIGGQIYFGTAAGSIGHFSLPKFAFDGRGIKIH